MFIQPRDSAACQSEIEAVKEYADRVFGIEVDFSAFREQVRAIIQNRVQDYIYQRFRDWPIRDLLELERQIGSIVPAETIEEAPRAKRGRPAKIES